MSDSPSSLPRFDLASVPRMKFLIRGGFIVLILLMALSSWMVLLALRAQVARGLENTTRSLAQSVTQTFDGLLDTVDVALQSLADGLQRDDDLELRSPQVAEALRRQRSRIPEIAHFWVADDKGVIINSSEPILGLASVDDRPFFKQLRANPASGLVVANPVIGYITKQWVWVFARRFDHPDGTFGGAVYATINISEVENMLDKIKMDPGGSLALRDRDLGLIARYTFGSENPTPIGSVKVSNTMTDALKANSDRGDYVSDANSLDPERRYYSYRRSQRYGYLANVGLSERIAFTTWRHQTWLVGALIALVGIILMTLSELLIRVLVRQGRFIQSLEARRIELDERNQALAEARTDMWQAANFDALTGLPNRRLLSDRLEQKLRRAKRDQSWLAVLFIDIDRFKEVNDTLGHDVGDQLLIEAAGRITASVRASDTVARLGGDEFTVVLSDVKEASDIGQIAQKIIDRLSAPYVLQGTQVYVSASIGIAQSAGNATTLSEMLKNADQAMYAAKNAGRQCFRFFSNTMQQEALTRIRLANDLRAAIEAGQLQIHYQPIVDLRTGRVTKAEALARWHHPERGMVSPAEFIPIAEETGLIHPLGNWVFEESVRQIKRWHELYSDKFQVSVNKSPIQFTGERHQLHQDKCGQQLCDLLTDAGLPGRCLVVEITENVLMESNDSVARDLQAFQAAGIEVAIDDFGTGYSSLSYLKKFDVDYLKIDRSFISNLTLGSADLMLCEAMVDMAHKLGIEVVAEGVETQEQRDLLVSIGCDFAQGYWFGRPMPAQAFEDFMREHEKTADKYQR